jgi:hypothetical protein
MGTMAQSKSLGHARAFAHREALPIPIVKDERFDQCSFFASTSSWCLEADGLIAGHGQHVGILVCFQPIPQVQIATINGISYDPGNEDLSLEDPFDHLLGQFWLCLEA